MARKKKLTKKLILTIVLAAVSCITAISLVVTNLFVPVKYLSAYIIFNKIERFDGLRVTYLDVGGGDCTLLELPDGKTAIIDGGSGARTFELRILKALNTRGIDKIDYLVCSSVDEKRSGGLAEIIKYKQVSKIYMPFCRQTEVNTAYRNFYSAAKNSGAEISYIEYGAGEFTGAFTLCFLSPSAINLSGGEYDLLNQSPTKRNIDGASAVIWLEAEGAKFLFSGDIPPETAKKLCDSHKEFGGFEMNGRIVRIDECNVLKVCGNGGVGYDSAPLYDITTPEYAVISCDNAPSFGALANAQNFVGDKLFRTDSDGAITITAKDGVISAEKEKR